MIQRNTTISSRVIDILKMSQHPLSVQQILVRLDADNLTPNKTTVYRILDKLIQAKEVHTIMLNNGVAYYEYHTGNHHHHHFFCKECELLYCLDGCHVEKFNIQLNELLPNPQFKITQHHFNLQGVCDTCAD